MILSRLRPVVAMLRTLLSVVRKLLFGFDMFISYKQGEASEYAKQLEQHLVSRDFTVFRDETNIQAGDRLSLVIRIAIRRTRMLVALGTAGATEEGWVADEIDMFKARGRDPVLVDLERLRDRGALGVLSDRVGDALCIADELTGPAEAVIDRIVAAHKGRRVNQLARQALIAVTGVLVSLAVWGSLTSYASFQKSQDLVAQSIFSIVQAHPDPLIQTLLLDHIDLARAPAGMERLAARIAEAPVPFAVLRDVPADIERMLFLPDESAIATVGYEWDGETRYAVVHTCPVDGRAREKLARLQDWTIDEFRLATTGKHLLVFGDRRVSVIGLFDRSVRILHPPQESIYARQEALEEQSESEPAADGALATDEPAFETSEYEDAQPDNGDLAESDYWFDWHFMTPWRISDDTSMGVFIDRRGLVLIDTTTFRVRGRHDLGDRTALDVRFDTPDGRRLTALCLDSTLMRLTLSDDGRIEISDEKRLLSNGERITVPTSNVDDTPSAFVGNAYIVVELDQESGEGGPPHRLLVYDLDAQSYRTWDAPKAMKPWVVSDVGGRLLIMNEDESVGTLDLSTVSYRAQPEQTVGRVYTQEEMLRGVDPDEDPRQLYMDKVAMSADGSLVLFPSVKFSMLWNTAEASGGLTRLPANNLNSVNDRPVFSPSGKSVALIEFGEIRLWSTSPTSADPSSLDLRGPCRGLGICDEKVIVSCDDGSIAEVELSTRHMKSFPVGSTSDGVVRTYLSRNGTVAVLVYQDGRMRAIEADSQRILNEQRIENAEAIGEMDMRISNRLACWVDPTDKTVLHLWDWQQGKLHRFAHPEEIERIAMASDSKVVATVDEDRFIRRITTDKQMDLGKLPECGTETVWTLELSPDGNSLLSGIGPWLVGYCLRGSIWRHRICAPEEDDECWSVGFLKDGFVIGTENGRLGLGTFREKRITRWLVAPELQQASDEPHLQYAHAGLIYEIVVSASGDRFASHDGIIGTVNIWDSKGTRLRSIRQVGVNDLRNMQFTHHGDELVILWSDQLSAYACTVEQIVQRINARTDAVLTPAERVRYLGESQTEARERYEIAEREHGRIPLPPEKLLEVDLDF